MWPFKKKELDVNYIEAFKQAKGKTGWQKHNNTWYCFGPACPECGHEMERGYDMELKCVTAWHCVHCNNKRSEK